MISATYSKDPYWERTVFLYVNQNEDLISNINEKERSKIVLLMKGSILVTYQGATSCVISGPALLFIDEQKIPQIVIKEEIQAMAIYFHPSTLNDALTYEVLRSPQQELQSASTTLQDAVLLYPVLGVCEFADRNRWLRLSPSVYVRCKSLIQQMQEELSEQKDGYWPCRSRSYLIELLIVITNLFEAETGSDYGLIPEEIDPLLSNALEYIHTNYGGRITLEDLSKEFGANRNLLTVAFKEKFQLTPMQYLIHHRIHVACSLLTDTELPVTEIALRTGFFDLSHFGRTFRKYMNCSPATYRNLEKS